jgi:hypothetical protein
LRQAGSKDILALGKSFINAKRGRLGMALSQNEREQSPLEDASGRGWPAKERANDAW